MRALAEICADLEQSGIIKSSSDRLVESWTDLLSRYQFEWFVTFTFREDIHPEKADKLFRSWVRRLNMYLHGRRQSAAKQVFWVRALEWQKRGVIHFHALIGDTDPIADKINFGSDSTSPQCLMYWNELWFQKAGICRIEEIRSEEDVNKYISKYIAKDGEIDVSPNLIHFVPPQRGLLAR